MSLILPLKLDDFQYMKGIDYRVRWSDHACECDDDICRCATIESTEITAFNFKELEMCVVGALMAQRQKWMDLKVSKGGPLMDVGVSESILRYALSKIFILNLGFDINQYAVDYSQGYYGDEVNKITFAQSQKLNRDWLMVGNLHSDRMIIEFLLTREYGHLMDHVQNRDWIWKEVKASDVIIQTQEHYLSKVCDAISKTPVLTSMPLIVIQEDPDREVYRLVDGYHRYAQEIAENQSSFYLIVGQPTNMKPTIKNQRGL